MRWALAGVATGVTVAVVGVGTLVVAPAPHPTTPYAASSPAVADASAPPVVRAAVRQEQASRAAYTLLIGDSIARRSRSELERLRPTWVIDAKEGRTPDRLLPLLRTWVAEKDRRPAQLVVALGTNTSRAWEPEDYRRVRRLLPDTQITFVTPFRAVAAGRDPSQAAYARERTGDYAEEMRRLAGRDGMCVADWRELVGEEPSLLGDGVHPTRAGRRAWAGLVASAMRRC
jgi:hypothetical protein